MVGTKKVDSLKRKLEEQVERENDDPEPDRKRMMMTDDKKLLGPRLTLLDILKCENESRLFFVITSSIQC